MNPRSLCEFLRIELTTIPVEHWKDYFPLQVAVLRFLGVRYPGKVALTRAGFDKAGPYVAGQGINWFADDLWTQEDILELADLLLTGVVVDLKRRYPEGVDTPTSVLLDADMAARLERRIVEEADKAVCDGRL
jgi:hypothetical protein